MLRMHIYTVEHDDSMNETCVGSLNTETLPRLNTKLFYDTARF
jgi:hypothetical protein